MERRLAAILAADVVGYSRLMEADEEATARTLGAYREIVDGLVADHHGRVFGSAGDSVVAEFPSPVEAVRCAVDIQRELEARNVDLAEDRRMRLRIGVNLGDVMVDGDNLLGDGVNIAARLEGQAAPGGVCISDDVYRQVRGKVSVEFEDLGKQDLKNISQRVRVFRVVAGIRKQSVEGQVLRGLAHGRRELGGVVAWAATDDRAGNQMGACMTDDGELRPRRAGPAARTAALEVPADVSRLEPGRVDGAFGPIFDQAQLAGAGEGGSLSRRVDPFFCIRWSALQRVE